MIDGDIRELLARAYLSSGRAQRRIGLASFQNYAGRELDFCTDVLSAKLWEAQREIIEKLTSKRFVAVRSGRKAGKTETAALAALSFLYTGKAVVLTTAPTGRQVRDVLWQRIGSIWNRARARFPEMPGELGTVRLAIAPEHYALGVATNSPDRFQGWHAGVVPTIDEEDADTSGGLEKIAEQARREAKRLVVIIDEAAGVDHAVFQALEGSMSGPNVHVLLTANPTIDADSGHFFARAFHNPRWWRVRISGTADESTDPVPCDSSFVVPSWLADQQWLEQVRAEWGEDSPLWSSYVLGRFPEQSMERRFVTRGMLVAASDESQMQGVGNSEDLHIGVDVARQGTDESVATLWAGGTLAVQHAWRCSDLMQTATAVVELAHAWGIDGNAVPGRNIHIDSVGIGAGVVDRLRQMGYMVDAVDYGAAPKYDWRSVTGQMVFTNRKSELHWVAKRLLEERRICIPERFKDVWRQAMWTRYEFDDGAKGTRVSIHGDDGKDGLRMRYGRSPDHWDSALLGLSRSSAVKAGFRVEPRFKVLRTRGRV
jgi:phage terminase large subunit